MNWIYNTLPNTGREVMAACITDNGNVYYSITHRGTDGEMVIPRVWKFIAWADFPRCMKDVDGNALAHHWLNVEGLEK